MLHIPLKKTDEVDFGPAFRQFIAATYQEEPEKYALEIETLNKLRQDIRGVGKDMTGRDILYRYYGQLELLDLRFPIEEKTVKIVFNWYDAFSSAKVSQHSVAYEKACVIFNLAGVCSAIGSFQNRTAAVAETSSGATTPTSSSASTQGSGLKLAFNYFQCAAGLFQFINDNFLHAPSVDLGRDSIKCLSELMLAQAQETFFEKVVIEKKKGALPAKLAGQCGAMYNEVYDAMNGAVLKTQFERTWCLLLQIKGKYFQAMAQYHRSIACEAESKYGERVARLIAAETLAKEANKLASSFASAYPSFFISTDNSAGAAASVTAGGISDFFGVGASTSGPAAGASSSSQAMLEMTRTLLTSVTDLKNLAQKDNDLIYHDTIPSSDSLESVPKLQAVKPLTFAEVCAGGASDIPKIVGPDIFAKLVPISVHEASSCYSEEKAKLWRGEEAKVAEADGELQATIASMDINKTLDQLRRLGRPDAGADEFKTLPPEVREWCEEIGSNEGGRAGGESLDEMTGVLEGLKARAKEALQGVGLALDDEQRECEGMRMKFMELWSQEPSIRLTSTIRADIRRHREALEKAQETDFALMNKVSECKSDLEILSKPVNEVAKLFAEVVTAGDSSISSGGDLFGGSTVKVGTLLDEDVVGSEKDGALGVLGEQLLIERMDSYLVKLRQLKKERGDIVEELKTKLHSDDISPLLLLNKNKEAQLFHSELGKFKPFQVRLQSNIAQQSQLLAEIGNEYTRLKNSSFGMKILEQREKRRVALVSRWQRAWETWRECREGFRKGIKFYADLTDMIDRTGEDSKEFVRRRAEERNTLAQSLHNDLAERGQRQLKEQLERLKLGSGSPAQPNASPPLPPPIASRLPPQVQSPVPPIVSSFARDLSSGGTPTTAVPLPEPAQLYGQNGDPTTPTAPPVSPFPTYVQPPPPSAPTFSQFPSAPNQHSGPALNVQGLYRPAPPVPYGAIESARPAYISQPQPPSQALSYGMASGPPYSNAPSPAHGHPLPQFNSSVPPTMPPWSSVSSNAPLEPYQAGRGPSYQNLQQPMPTSMSQQPQQSPAEYRPSGTHPVSQTYPQSTVPSQPSVQTPLLYQQTPQTQNAFAQRPEGYQQLTPYPFDSTSQQQQGMVPQSQPLPHSYQTRAQVQGQTLPSNIYPHQGMPLFGLSGTSPSPPSLNHGQLPVLRPQYDPAQNVPQTQFQQRPPGLPVPDFQGSTMSNSPYSRPPQPLDQQQSFGQQAPPPQSASQMFPQDFPRAQQYGTSGPHQHVQTRAAGPPSNGLQGSYSAIPSLGGSQIHRPATLEQHYTGTAQQSVSMPNPQHFQGPQIHISPMPTPTGPPMPYSPLNMNPTVGSNYPPQQQVAPPIPHKPGTLGGPPPPLPGQIVRPSNPPGFYTGAGQQAWNPQGQYSAPMNPQTYAPNPSFGQQVR
ncbi:bck1-like resistance to osmotic shock [Gonapodya sp. JEL0774]|nr:bck1-like resistance to osmotic shock [Gonapodya sp. JEL0774]